MLYPLPYPQRPHTHPSALGCLLSTSASTYCSWLSIRPRCFTTVGLNTRARVRRWKILLSLTRAGCSSTMDILTPRWVRYKRDASRQENPGRGSHCPHCHDPLPQPFRLEAWRTHVSNSPASHQALQSDADIVQSFHSLVFGTAATRSQR